MISSNKICPNQAVRGMSDILPGDSSYWRYVEDVLRAVVTSYGYQEIRFPIIESTGLFVRTIGEVTDIVEKEMYTFADRNGDSLTLRPEGTAGCVRAGVQHGLFYNQIQRLWYTGPMFRHERPQKGRFRQFHQFGVEVFGLSGPDIDAELLLMSARFWQKLGIADKVTLQLNTLGTEVVRTLYREKLINYFNANFEMLDEDSKRRLTTNPLRILDSKNPHLGELISSAPKLLDNLDDASRIHFDGLCRLLDAAGLKYVINPCLVRGLDYYCHTAFEWVTDELGAQGTICGGGHYDKLVERLGGKATCAVGFALGLERLIELVRVATSITVAVDVYMIVLGDAVREYSLILAEELRTAIPKLELIINCGDGSLATQLKRADKSNAQLALIIGEDELKQEQVTVKWLRDVKTRQEAVSSASLITFLMQQLKLGRL